MKGSKTIKAHNLDVRVSHEIKGNVVVLNGSVGKSQSAHYWTIGETEEGRKPHSKARPAPPTKEQLQAALDNAREHVAHEAAFKHHVSEALKGVK